MSLERAKALNLHLEVITPGINAGVTDAEIQAGSKGQLPRPLGRGGQ